tara:strand:+ start:90 stop:668 length:579 start_codon:yes stop_codon:yes gene_type:complete
MKKDTLKFDEETHTYTLDGNVVPSVTSIIADILDQDYSNIDPWYAEFGVSVHKAIEYENNGELDEGSVSDEAMVCLESYRNFVKESYLECIVSEQRGINRELWVAGTMDMVCKLHNGVYIIDVKTGTKQKWHKLQTAGYSLLYDNEQEYPPKRGALYLSRKGGYQFEPHNDNRDVGVFLSMTRVYHGKRRYL